MTIPRILLLLKTTAVKWWDDNPWRLSAALSYYTLFSLAPLFTIAVAVAAVVVDESIVQSELLRQFEDLIGKPGATTITAMLQSAGHPVHGTIATLISLITLFIVSMGMFSELQDALNLIAYYATEVTSLVDRVARMPVSDGSHDRQVIREYARASFHKWGEVDILTLPGKATPWTQRRTNLLVRLLPLRQLASGEVRLPQGARRKGPTCPPPWLQPFFSVTDC